MRARVVLAPRGASRLVTSIRLQAIEYGHLRALLAIVLVLPIVIFLATYYGTPAGAAPVRLVVPDQGGDLPIELSQRIAYSEGMGIMGVAWALATMAFFGVMGNLQRDRRLVLSGYPAWQILTARLCVLAAVALPLAAVGVMPAALAMPARHPELVFLADLCAGLIAAAFGMLVGTLLPRATEGVLVVVIVIGLGMSLGQDAGRFFFLYPALQLLISARLAPHPAVALYLGQTLLVMALFLGPSLGVWWWRTRIVRHPGIALHPMASSSADLSASAGRTAGGAPHGDEGA